MDMTQYMQCWAAIKYQNAFCFSYLVLEVKFSNLEQCCLQFGISINHFLYLIAGGDILLQYFWYFKHILLTILMYFNLIRILNSGLSHVAEHFYTVVFVQSTNSTSPTTAELLIELMEPKKTVFRTSLWVMHPGWDMPIQRMWHFLYLDPGWSTWNVKVQCIWPCLPPFVFVLFFFQCRTLRHYNSFHHSNFLYTLLFKSFLPLVSSVNQWNLHWKNIYRQTIWQRFVVHFFFFLTHL